jgi:6-phosphogluconolactonase (cycloisomerase 2 family)
MKVRFNWRRLTPVAARQPASAGSQASAGSERARPGAALRPGRRGTRRISILAAIVAAATAAVALPAGAVAATPDAAGVSPAVFVQTNDPSGNAVLSFERAADGSLTQDGSFATGGLGGTTVGAPTDPLASQDSLVLDRDRGLLYAVNAGSDSLSVFSVEGTHLTLRQVIPSGGDFPVSVTTARNLLYVLNAGGEGSVVGFAVAGDRLVRAEDASRSLGLVNASPPFFLTSPAQVGLSPDGAHLVVTTKVNRAVDVFDVAPGGRLSEAPAVTNDTGPVPFAFEFDRAGRLVLSDASGIANTFALGRDGGLSALGSDAPNGQAATCWIVGARGFFYATNTGSDTITGYAQDSAGQLRLLSPDGVSARTDGGPIDIAATPSGRFVYELNGTGGTLGIYKVARDGGLTKTGSVTGLPAFDGVNGMQGLAVA